MCSSVNLAYGNIPIDINHMTKCLPHSEWIPDIPFKASETRYNNENWGSFSIIWLCQSKGRFHLHTVGIERNSCLHQQLGLPTRDVPSMLCLHCTLLGASCKKTGEWGMKQTTHHTHRDLRVSMQQGAVIKQKAGLMENLKQGLKISFGYMNRPGAAQGGRGPGESLLSLSLIGTYC